ncbi:type IX secretion system anionic LPS delivery protein PorZ [Pontibacter harenae]|uniref:type IX secretion system anionic LPS delivery protein PorZ n=1 Tax=Pontibacter harenae TaxID=2894083 RepID=UPI001E4E701C|nr:T9SS type A sorting domain-containing protein [Pontibacter harenae]MCC9167789.1 T9SS type A sorting domain-containing protein [Pontibacter harenae]
MNHHQHSWQKLKYLKIYFGVWLGLLLTGYSSLAQSQVPLGAWQVHVPFQNAKAVVEAGDNIYVAAEQGLFYYDKAFNSIETLTKLDGLKEQLISTIGYDQATQTLIIAYKNTSIDLIRQGRIFNIGAINRRQLPGEKKINHILVHNKLAYLSASFGVVVLDLQKQEIKETYSNIGPEGTTISIKEAAVLGDSIFVATANSVLGASLSANLQDFASWSSVSESLPPVQNITTIEGFNNELYLGTSGQGVFNRQGSNWQAALPEAGESVYNLSTSGGILVAVSEAKVVLQRVQGQTQVVTNDFLQAAQQAIAGTDNILWVADYNKGLIRINLATGERTAFAPDGPYSSQSFNVYAANGSVYGLSGGYNQNYQPFNSTNGFYKYKGGIWENYNSTLASFPAVKDLVDAVYNPVTGKLYFASYGSGLLEWESLEKHQLYNTTNSTLVANTAGEVWITDVATDASGNVWVVNRHQLTNRPGLHVLRPDGNWQSYTLPGIPDGANLEQLVIDDFGNKWLSTSRSGNSRSGLVIYSEEGQRVRSLTTGTGNGNLPSGAVHALAKDLNGDIWVGTAAGVAVFYNTGAVFSSQNYDARVPIINRRPLLDGQTVHAIAVDGANRKWIGTDNGLWLLGPDGDELLAHFTSANSPLPSNTVQTIAVEHQTGEVFVATDAGMASYRAGATVTEGTPGCAVVFPNPVRREFTGMVGISDLPNNAQVRITDINGTLVYKGQATGGTFTWNVRGYNGKRVKAGVYLVLSSDKDGQNACVSKIAVLE